MSLRLDTKEGYWTIMSVCAPQVGCPEHDKDKFYFTHVEAIRSVQGDGLFICSRGHKRARGELQKMIGKVYRKLKRLAKAAVAKSAEINALYETRGEKFATRLAKARHRACVDIRVIKTMKSFDSRVLRKPSRSEKDISLVRTVLYADDIALLAHSREQQQKMVRLWQAAFADNSLQLNVRKTKFISCEQCTELPRNGCQGKVIEKVEEFRYLGSDLVEEGSVDQAVRARISAAWLKRKDSAVFLCDRRWACGWTRWDNARKEDVRALMKTAAIQLKMREKA
ncbi:unnamed protein product [Heligmosomoides polygyrus]|uniref:Reverse transcriptase domain-containing protein n=1 Tax=Heligmosomoides polygyrus TaxID=6339 RepID=A0A183FED6_HELPZ|nr:unnamed protein product [Heligmosomoides polygyrus]